MVVRVMNLEQGIQFHYWRLEQSVFFFCLIHLLVYPKILDDSEQIIQPGGIRNLFT